MKNLSVVFSSHFTDAENEKFIAHLKATAGVNIHVECVKNMNEYSLPQAYNLAWKKLDDLGRGQDIIVFCHNDLTIRTENWGKKLLGLFKTFSDYDILGIAGTTELNAHGCWWLDNGGKEMNRTKMFGRVWHTNGIREWESVYSENIHGVQPVVIVDGLFIAVNGETVVKRFNEDFKGFHFYDITFSFDNYIEGCNIGVIDKISVLHQSVGQTNQSWELNRQQFASTYAEELPVQHD
jgi:hypothetical protein